jgi:excisionase family DNA binding protein
MDELTAALRAIIRDEVARQLAELTVSAPEPPVGALLSVDEAAAWLGLQTKTLYEWRHLRKGPPSVQVGRLVKYRPETVEEWITRPIYGDDVLMIHEAAEYPKRHPRTVTDACRAGQLNGVQRGKGASWRIRREELDRWMRVKAPG